MARILITSGPTRQYLDPVRYLTNASSGLMGAAIAKAALSAGHEVTVVSGPVNLNYDSRQVISVISTDEMLAAAADAFQHCDGLIGVAAPCDYRPQQIEDHKIAKTGRPLMLELHETPDVVATLGASKGHRWVVGFALETNDHHFRGELAKLERKCCDLIVLNSPAAMDAASNSVELLAPSGDVLLATQGPKQTVARELFEVIERRLISR